MQQGAALNGNPVHDEKNFRPPTPEGCSVRDRFPCITIQPRALYIFPRYRETFV